MKIFNKNLFGIVIIVVFLYFGAEITIAVDYVDPPESIPLSGIFRTPTGSNSYIESNNVIITDKNKNQIGSIFSTEQNKLDLTQNFESEMYIYIDGSADGIAFVMHNDPEKVKVFSGLVGNGLSIYGEKIIKGSPNIVGTKQLKNSFAVEFDTYYNGDSYDSGLNANENKGHIAYSFPDKLSTYRYYGTKITGINHLGLQYPTFKLGDAKWRLFKIKWTSWDKSNVGHLTYSFGNLETITVNIPKSIFQTDNVYWGFTGSTGNVVEKAIVAFSSVPGLVNYDDDIIFENKLGEEVSHVTQNSEITVHYRGKYKNGKQNLIKPIYSFTLSQNQVYIDGSLLVNDLLVQPQYTNNQLQIPLSKDLTTKDAVVDIKFKISNKDTIENQILNVGVQTKGENFISENKSSYKIFDNIPPVATPKLIKVDLGDTTALQDPKAGVATYSDETTTAANMKFEFVTSAEDRINMINKLGVYNVDINVIDEAGNKTLVTAPVLVHPAGETITDGYVLGNDFNIDYNTWLNATDDQRRSFLIDEDYGSVKGFAISENTVTDVTNDPAKMVVTMPTTTWAPNKTYAVSVKVNSYTKKVNVTLVPSAVKMTMKQVYTGTDRPIYSNLETKVPVDNTVSSEETIGDTITAVMNNQISAGAFTLNYEGYDDVTVSDYKIYQNGVEVTPTPTTVPNEDFTIVYEYNGQLKFKDVAKKLDFGSITISEDSTKSPLSDASDETISIINTVQNSSWKLKASMPTGINQIDGKKQAFLGSVIYKNATGTNQTIGQSATIMETQKENSLYSQLSLKNDSTGMFLQQDAGNLKGSYTGSLVWTLEDTP